jgi:hypothetical protein
MGGRKKGENPDPNLLNWLVKVSVLCRKLSEHRRGMEILGFWEIAFFVKPVGG